MMTQKYHDDVLATFSRSTRKDKSFQTLHAWSIKRSLFAIFLLIDAILCDKYNEPN